jgi:hypothetical protein
VGLFDIFKGRRADEDALAQAREVEPAAESQALGSFAKFDGENVVGQQVQGAPANFGVEGMSAADGLAMLSQLGPMIQQAMATGNVQITQGEPQVLDLRGTGLREEIMGIMSQHGIDPAAGTGENVNAANYGDMQKQILQALANHGVPTGIEPPPQPESDSGS